MTRAPPPGLLELSPVERGVVSIFGVASRFFVAMSSKGKLYGSVSTAGAGRAPGWGSKGSTATLPGRPVPGSCRRGGHRVGTASPIHKYPEAVPVTPGLSRRGAESHHRNSEVSPLPRAAPSSP